MRNKKGILCCDVCKKPIEELTEEKALEDMEGHGWTNHETAQMHGCFHCGNRFDRWGQPFIYETYFAGRYKDLPDGTRKVFAGFDGVYSIRDRDEMKSGGITQKRSTTDTLCFTWKRQMEDKKQNISRNCRSYGYSMD